MTNRGKLASWTKWLICLAMLVPAALYAAQYQQFGEVRVYYNSIRSTLIPEQVATLHGVVRADNQALINIAIKTDSVPAQARLSGFSTNLINQTRRLAFIEVQEQSAIYYLANATVGKNEILRFTVNIEIDNHADPILLKFEQAFY